MQIFSIIEPVVYTNEAVFVFVIYIFYSNQQAYC